jgi:hypothetical protein
VGELHSVAKIKQRLRKWSGKFGTRLHELSAKGKALLMLNGRDCLHVGIVLANLRCPCILWKAEVGLFCKSALHGTKPNAAQSN